MPKIRMECYQCGRVFWEHKSQRRSKYKFCSRKCKYKWNKILPGYWEGKKMPKSAREKMKANHAKPWLGRKHTEAWKKMMSERLKGKNNPMYGKTGKQNPFYGKHHSRATKKKLSKMRKGKATTIGKDHPNWQGGKSFEPYSEDFNGQLKRQIRERDNCACRVCYRIEEALGYKLSCHHIDYDKENLNQYNLISLCRRCHGKTNYNKEYWQKRFNKA